MGFDLMYAKKKEERRQKEERRKFFQKCRNLLTKFSDQLAGDVFCPEDLGELKTLLTCWFSEREIAVGYEELSKNPDRKAQRVFIPPSYCLVVTHAELTTKEVTIGYRV